MSKNYEKNNKKYYEEPELTDEQVEEMFSTSKGRGRTRGERRKNDLKKAVRKRAIDKELTSDDGVLMYSNVHQYSKNKIHCSCCLCRGKDRFGRHILSEQEIRNYGKYEEELADLYNGEEVLA